uniref:Aftiphilin a n=1 Tax=Nothobranchius rachovii TaxID=451742 RepID=A0A1A8RCA1_9TELE
MESDIMVSCHPPPRDGGGDGGVGLKEDGFEDVALGMVCSPLGLADATEPPSFLKQTCPPAKPAVRQPNSSFNPPSEQTQLTSLHLSNGHAQVDLKSVAFSASVVNFPEEETGFADFTVFTEQSGHPWCCGFTERWDGEHNGAGEHTRGPGQAFVTDSEPRSQHSCEAEEDVCIDTKHCEKRNAALVQPPQDHQQPQDAAAALSFVKAGEEQQISRNAPERRCSCDSLQRTSEKVPQTFTEDQLSDELVSSCCDDFSFESVSAELEPNVSSLVSGDDPTDDEEEYLEDSRHPDTFVYGQMTNLSLCESNLHHCNHYVNQETSATSTQLHSGKSTLDKFPNRNVEHHGDHRAAQTADTGVQSLGNLPSSDSFADFCSAPSQEDEGGLWEDFKDQSMPMKGKPCTQFREPANSCSNGRNNDNELESFPKIESRRKNCEASLSDRVQQLLQSSFPEVLVPAVEGDEDLLNLGALLTTQHLTEHEEDKPELSHALRIQQQMLRPYQDFYCSLGLQFQWGGSRTKSSLLRCLGVDTRNIICMGTKKQPVTVTTYASGLVLPSSQLDWSRSQEGASPCRLPHP